MINEELLRFLYPYATWFLASSVLLQLDAISPSPLTTHNAAGKIIGVVAQKK
jgi:hypothetical protein